MTRAFGVIVAVGSLALLAAVLITRILVRGGGPEGELITRLKHLERDQLETPLPCGTLTSRKLQYQRLAVTVSADGHTATVSGTLDFEGTLQRASGRTQISSLGLERIEYATREGEWRPTSTDLPRLSAIVCALEARRVAIERGEPDALGTIAHAEVGKRRLESQAWYVRSERAEVVVSEDARLTGETPDRPIDRRLTTRLRLVEADDGRFSFPSGFM